MVKGHRNVLNSFSSPVFSSFLPHLLLFNSYTLPCVALPFSSRKVFSGRLFYFFGKVDGWGEKREWGRRRVDEKSVDDHSD